MARPDRWALLAGGPAALLERVAETPQGRDDPPLIAMMEGLDYLACLLRPKNFDKILAGFTAMVGTPGAVVPSGFDGTRPDRTRRPTLVVLAPEAYFTGRQSRSIRGRDWPLLAAVGETMMESVCVVFAATDFRSPALWKPPVPLKR